MSKFSQANRRGSRRGVLPPPGGGQLLSTGCFGGVVSLFWTPIAPLPDNWILFRSVSGFPAEFLKSVLGNSTGTSDLTTSCPGITPLEYQVFATNAGGVGPGSNFAQQLGTVI